MRALPAHAEVTVAPILARLAVWLVPFRWLARSVAEPGIVPPGTIEADPRAAGVGRVVTRAAERLPWRATFLVRAVATRLVLARKGIPSVLSLGITMEDGAVRAHAWLLAGGGIVRGGREAMGYTSIAAITTGRAA